MQTKKELDVKINIPEVFLKCILTNDDQQTVILYLIFTEVEVASSGYLPSCEEAR